MAGKVTVVGLPQLDAALKMRAVALGAATAAIVAAEVQSIEADAERGAPRDTGELAGSVNGTASGTSGEVEATARHSGFVEFGTSDTPAQPFMGPAANRARTRIPGRVTAALRKAVG